jgi:hypothetical protein
LTDCNLPFPETVRRFAEADSKEYCRDELFERLTHSFSSLTSTRSMRRSGTSHYEQAVLDWFKTHPDAGEAGPEWRLANQADAIEGGF